MSLWWLAAIPAVIALAAFLYCAYTDDEPLNGAQTRGDNFQ